MIEFIRRYPRMLFFGLLAAFFSSPGQTFLVSLFIPHLREDFGLSQTAIAGLYSVVTLLSALCLPLLGRLLDRVNLQHFALAAGCCLVIGCLLTALSTNLVILFTGLFLVRNMGQGNFSMIASTSMARIFSHERGKALGFANLGYPLGEAVFPILVSTCILMFGWRWGWGLLAGVVVVIFFPCTIFLLRDETERKATDGIAVDQVTFLEDNKSTARKVVAKNRSFRDMLMDRRFYLLLWPALIPPAYLTALFFHQASLMSQKGWSLQAVSAAFIVFGVSRGVVSFAIGPWVDRYSARQLFPCVLIPFAAGLLCLVWGQSFWCVPLYLAGAGVSMGLGMTISGALWAELYGTAHLGTIRGILFSLVVLSTAIAPPLMGWFLDAGTDPSALLRGMLVGMAVGIGLAWMALNVVPAPWEGD